MKKLNVTVDGRSYEVEIEPLESSDAGSETPAAPAPSSASAGGASVESPLAGKVVEVQTAVGDSVSEGDTLLILEAMKMNTLVSAPASGTVSSINVAAGDMVEEGQVLLTIG